MSERAVESVYSIAREGEKNGEVLQRLHCLFNPFTLRDTLESIVCYSDTFVNNLGTKLKFTKYLK